MEKNIEIKNLEGQNVEELERKRTKAFDQAVGESQNAIQEKGKITDELMDDEVNEEGKVIGLSKFSKIIEKINKKYKTDVYKNEVVIKALENIFHENGSVFPNDNLEKKYLDLIVEEIKKEIEKEGDGGKESWEIVHKKERELDKKGMGIKDKLKIRLKKEGL